MLSQRNLIRPRMCHKHTSPDLLQYSVTLNYTLNRPATISNSLWLTAGRRSLEKINSSGNCATLIMAAIIYWQAKEISRVVKEHNPGEAGVDLSLLEHVSPIGWSNVIIYGDYALNRGMIR